MRRSMTAFLAAAAVSACGSGGDVPPPLPDDPLHRAAVCFYANLVLLRDRADQDLTGAEYYDAMSYAAFTAAHGEGEASTYDRVADFTNDIDAYDTRAWNARPAAEAARADCLDATPQASRSHVVTLPDEPVRSALVCASVARWLPGTLEPLEPSDLPDYNARGEAILSGVHATLTRYVTDTGVASADAMETIYQEAFAESLSLGRPDTVFNHCAERWP